MRRGVGEALVSVGALAILLFTLVSLDDRVREQFALRLSVRPSTQLASITGNLRELTSVVVAAARDQSLEHAPLLVFTLAAVVLVLFMLRT